MRKEQAVRGFSLSELLVVVAVILVLLAILIVGIDKIYGHAMQVKCAHRLEQLGHALEMYKMQSHTLLPPSWDPSSGRLWYQSLAAVALDDPKILSCPVVGEPVTVTDPGSSGSEGGREEADQVWRALNWLKSKKGENNIVPGAKPFYWPQSSTGLTLLAFFGFGCTDKHPAEFASTVRDLVEYLSSEEAQYKTGEDRGRFKQDRSAIYNQGICTMALAAAGQMIQDPVLRSKARAAAQLAVDWMVRAVEDADYGGFTYSTPYDASLGGNVDLNATAWFYHGLTAARQAGLSVPQSVFDKASDENQGVFYWAYAALESGAAYYGFRIPNVRKHFSGGYTNTPVLLATRLVMGQSPNSEPCVANAEYMYRTNMPTTRLLQMEQNGESLTYTIYFTSEAMARMGGKYEEQWRQNFFPEHLMVPAVPDGDDMLYWPNTACKDPGGSWNARGLWGDVYATAMACLALEASYDDYWLLPTWRPPTAKCSYGYNNRLGKDRKTPAADTIVIMDYENWEIDHDDIDIEENDTRADIAARHGGRANALMGDGSVRAFRPDEVKDGHWTPEAGD